MILKTLRKVFRRPALDLPTEPARLPLGTHGITRQRFSPAALKVCDGLQSAGYQAYIVGGAVRDLLIGREPKDFDVATSATPEQVRAVFRRSRIIGRRFRIVHVMHRDETIEVSTFRALHDDKTTERDEHGRVLRDNTYGSMAEDATRRDFTANALYFDPANDTIVDYHGGYSDLGRRSLRMIGNPQERYREDPVRMLRAVRLSAKLGLAIDPAAQAPIREMAELLGNVPAARLLDEMLKLLFSGHAVRCLTELREQHLHHGLLPLLDVILEQPMGERFVWLALENTDQRISENKPVSPGFLFATLLWHQVLAQWQVRQARGEAEQPALFEAMDDVLATQGGSLAITRRIQGDIKEIWALQPRFLKTQGGGALRLLAQPRYRAAWDFLRLRAQAGEVDMALPDWWANFAHASNDERQTLQQAAPAGATSDTPKRRRRRRRKPAAADGPVSDA